LTEPSPPANNDWMRSRRIAQSIVCGLLSVAVAGLLLLPQEHLHAQDVGDPPHSNVLHRHFAEYQTGSTHSGSLNHSKSEPHWLSSSLGGPVKGPRIDRIDTVLCIPVILVRPPVQTRSNRFLLGQPSAHGPPTAAPPGLRAPPSSSL
jgi:hypothetical protein